MQLITRMNRIHSHSFATCGSTPSSFNCFVAPLQPGTFRDLLCIHRGCTSRCGGEWALRLCNCSGSGNDCSEDDGLGIAIDEAQLAVVFIDPASTHEMPKMLERLRKASARHPQVKAKVAFHPEEIEIAALQRINEALLNGQLVRVPSSGQNISGGFTRFGKKSAKRGGSNGRTL